MQKLLRQKTTGTIYVWTPLLAERHDMEIYTPPPKDTPKQPVEQAPEAENTSQNLEQASADEKPKDDLSEAMTAFRRQVSKVGRKPATKSSEQA